MKDFYKLASQLKIRYRSAQGLITVEDLWGISLEALDQICVFLYRAVNSKQEAVSFLKEVKSAETEKDEVAFAVAKDILDTRVAKRTREEEKLANKREREKLLDIIESKKNQELTDMSMEELQKRVAELA